LAQKVGEKLARCRLLLATLPPLVSYRNFEVIEITGRIEIAVITRHGSRNRAAAFGFRDRGERRTD